MKDVADKKGARGKKTANAKVVSKYERSVKAGYVKTKEGAEFPNYFVAQKVRSKISAAEEEIGKKLFLKTEGQKKNKKGKGKKKGRRSSSEDEAMEYDGDNEPTIWHATKGNEEDFRNGEREKHEEEKE